MSENLNCRKVKDGMTRITQTTDAFGAADIFGTNQHLIMSLYKIPIPLARTLRSTIACLLAVVVCTAHTVAVAQPYNAYNTAFRNAFTVDNNVITIGNADATRASIVFPNTNTDPAVTITGRNITLRGSVTSTFASQVAAQSSQISNWVQAVLGGDSSALDNYSTTISAFGNTLGTHANSLSGITGNGLERYNFGSTQVLGDRNKWFTSAANINPGWTYPTSAYSANDLSLQNLRFGDVDVRYTNERFVNGLIGPYFNARETVSMRNITGNAFQNIDIRLRSDGDTHYLAGGGVVGIRATGEYPVPAPDGPATARRADAIMGHVSGNFFDNITIMATMSTDPGGGTDRFHLRPTDGATSAYLEGGGLVGVNAATSPVMTGNHDTTQRVYGKAVMDSLTNNYFTRIHIMSNDIFLGGGLVGLNNNSKTTDSLEVYARLPLAQGNIFGRGTGDRNGLNESFDINVEVAFSLRGGGVLGLNGLSAADIQLLRLEDNAFAGINVQAGSYLRGGGIVGLQTNDGERKMRFYRWDANANGIGEGGYVIVSHADIVSDTYASDIFIRYAGGTTGHVGEPDGWFNLGRWGFTNSVDVGNTTLSGNDVFTAENYQFLNPSTFTELGAAEALLLRAEGNLFLNQRIDVGSYLHGGGVVGLRGNFGAAALGTLEGINRAGDSEGGLIGNVFRGITVHVGTNAHMPDTVPPTSANNNNAVNKYLYGGGIVGVSAYNMATLARVQNNYFEDIIVRVTSGVVADAGELYGGGFIGVDAYDNQGRDGSMATIGYVEGNWFIGDGTTTNVLANRIYGGGIIGASNDSGIAQILNVTNENRFYNLRVATHSELVGGGVLGAWSDNVIVHGGLPGELSTQATAAIGTVEDNWFVGMHVEAGGHLEGGGIIGVRSNNEASIDTVRLGRFLDNEISVGTYLDGGGIIGATGGGDGATWIRLIDASVFSGNAVTTGTGDLFGGLVYTYGINHAEGMTIQNSLFFDNTFESTGGTVFGAVTVDTGGVATRNAAGHVLNLVATANSETIFLNNEILGGAFNPGDFNSIFIGMIPDPVSGTPDSAQADARLLVQADGLVALYDPIWVNQDNDKTFHMEVVAGNGDFVWGGHNIFTTTDAGGLEQNGTTGSITLRAGSTTTILDGTTRDEWVPLPGILQHATLGGGLEDWHTMTLTAKNFTFELENGAWLNIEGHNHWDFSNVVSSGLISAPERPDGTRPDVRVGLNGDLHFNLNNTNVARRGQLPGEQDGDAFYNPALLLIDLPTTGQNQHMVDLFGSTVHLSPVNVATGRELQDGDRFFLVEVRNGTVQGSAVYGSGADNRGDNPNQAFTLDTPYTFELGTPQAIVHPDRVTVASGVTRTYNFIIDLNGDNNRDGIRDSDENWREVNSRILVARIQDGPDPGVWVPPPNVVTFLHNDPPNIPAFIDPRCDPCAPVSCDPCAPRGFRGQSHGPSHWVRTPFAEVGGTWYRLDTGSGSYSDVRGVQFQGGLAAQRRAHNGDGRVIFGAFVDAGDGSYNSFNLVTGLSNPNLPEGYRARGIMDYLGGGVLLRREWNNGFRFDTVFRGGSVKERYLSSDIAAFTAEDIPVAYQRRNAYWGTSLGLNQRTHLNRRSLFDIYSRYSWLMVEGSTVDITQHDDASLNEHARFRSVHSHRLTSGARLTVQRHSRLSWYVGAAYEHEFDGRARAVVTGLNHDPLVLGGSNIRGGTGIGELGLIMRPRDWFQLTTGLEGYTGKRDGGSVFASAVWRW